MTWECEVESRERGAWMWCLVQGRFALRPSASPHVCHQKESSQGRGSDWRPRDQSTRLSTIKKTEHTGVDGDAEKSEPSDISRGNVNGPATAANSLAAPLKVKQRITTLSSYHIRGMSQRRWKQGLREIDPYIMKWLGDSDLKFSVLTWSYLYPIQRSQLQIPMNTSC